ncbi:hypothetical protein Tco_0192974, partial [Tanacetum coccineum]
SGGCGGRCGGGVAAVEGGQRGCGEIEMKVVMVVRGVGDDGDGGVTAAVEGWQRLSNAPLCGARW